MVEEKNKSAGTELPMTASEKSGGGKNYIIAIGIDKYALTHLNLPSCVKDCEYLTKILVDKYSFKLFGDIIKDDKATIANITQALQDFRDLPLTKDDSLIIYYSGHGYLFPLAKRPGTNEIIDSEGCWVTHECELSEKNVNSYLRIENILLQIRQLSVLRHIMLISDCCHAGFALDHPVFYKNTITVDKNDQLFEESQSRWAICAARNNQFAAAGTNNNPSPFTRSLIEQLEKNDKPRLLLTALTASVQVDFDAKEQHWQHPLALPLNIPGNAGGQFVFKAIEDEIAIKDRENILKAGISLLNYTDQRRSWKEFNQKGKVQFAIFTGRASCGLPYLSASARRNPIFEYQPAHFVSYDRFVGTGEARVLSGFNEALKTNFATIDLLRNEIVKRLRQAPLIIEIRFHPNPEEQDPILPGIKTKLLDDLGAFIFSINGVPDLQFHLFLFVIDYELFDYKQVYNEQKIASVDTTYIPPTIPIELEELDSWYDAMERYAEVDDSKLQIFRKRFVGWKDKLKNLRAQTKGYPGDMLVKICEEARCKNLIEKILKPD